MKPPEIILLSEFHEEGRAKGKFKCSNCGAEFIGRMSNTRKRTGYCFSCKNKSAGVKRRKHGHNNRNSRLHVMWSNMKRRCLNPVGKEKTIYQGINLCTEWNDFSQFLSWAVANGYRDDLTIDRRETTGNYEPSNCHFVGYSYQSANRKKTEKNTSGYVGVYWHKGKWQAYCEWLGDRKRLGRHTDKVEAAKARDKYVRDNNLPHVLNFPEAKN